MEQSNVLTSRRERVWLPVVAALVLLASCGVNDRVDARMHRPEVTDRFAEDPATADDQVDETTTTTEDVDVDAVDDVLSENVGDGDPSVEVTHHGSGFWEVDVDVKGGTVHIRAELDIDFVKLTGSELVELGIIDESNENLFRRDEWFSVSGTVSHDLLESGCTTDPDFDDCRLVMATDGSVVGLASIVNGRADIELRWRQLGRGSELGTPRLSVRTVDERGFSFTIELLDLAESLETRLVGRSVKVDVDDGPRIVQSIGGDGAGEIRLVEVD